VAWYAPAAVETPESDDPKNQPNAFGFAIVNHYASKDAELWPENWRTWKLFSEIRNQWRRAGLDGAAYALDYGVLFTRMDRLRLSDHEYEETFGLIKQMERAALDEMNRESD
jgi:hypothetical protein